MPEMPFLQNNTTSQHPPGQYPPDHPFWRAVDYRPAQQGQPAPSLYADRFKQNPNAFEDSRRRLYEQRFGGGATGGTGVTDDPYREYNDRNDAVSQYLLSDEYAEQFAPPQPVISPYLAARNLPAFFTQQANEPQPTPPQPFFGQLPGLPGVGGGNGADNFGGAFPEGFDPNKPTDPMEALSFLTTPFATTINGIFDENGWPTIRDLYNSIVNGTSPNIERDLRNVTKSTSFITQSPDVTDPNAPTTSQSNKNQEAIDMFAASLGLDPGGYGGWGVGPDSGLGGHSGMSGAEADAQAAVSGPGGVY